MTTIDPAMNYHEPDESEIAELRANERYKRRYQNQLTAHPHEQDPDHPGLPDDEESA